MSLRLKLNLRFDGDIVFSGFLPETQDDALQLTLREGRYHATIYLSDRKKQMSGFIGDIPNDPEQMKIHKTLYCHGLTMEIEVKELDPEVMKSLEAGLKTEKTEEFGREVFDVVMEVHEGLVSYFRNIAKQYCVKPIIIDSRNYENFLDVHCGTVWLDSNGTWRRFLTDRNRAVHITLTTWGNCSVDHDMWDHASGFIERGGRAQMRDVLIANSLEYLSQKNGRLAVVEAVTALESAVKQLLPKVILSLPGAPQIGEKELDKVIEQAGLRLVAQVGLKLIMTPAGLATEDIRIIGEAIDARNNVIHGPQRELEVSRAQRYVSAIRRVIETFEHWVK